MAVDWSQFKPVSGPVDWSQFKPYEEKKEGAFARAGRIARDEDGGVLAAAGSLIEAALPDSRVGRDTAVTTLKSAVGVPQSAIGLIDIASGGRFGRALEQAGIDPNAAQRALDELYSPETQTAKREVQAAEGFADTAGAMLRNPSTILTGIGESIAPMLAGGVVGRGAAALSSRLSPAAAAAIGEGALMAGQSASQIRGQTEDGLLTPTQSALAAGTGVVGGIIGRAGGALSNKVGIGDVDTAIVQGALTESAKRPGFLARTALGAGIEGGVEEMPQSIVEQAAQNVALGKPWDEGLGSAAAQGLVVGAPFGAVGANLSRPAAAPEPAPAADPLDAQADRFRAATDAYLKDKPGADTIADVVSQPTVDAAIDALGAASPSMDEILAGKRQRAAQRVAEELGFADQVDARSPEQIMADAAARREQAALAAQQELGLSPTSAGAAPDPRTAEQIVADFEARRQAAVEQLQGAPAGQAPRTEQDFAARRREAALAAISDMGESLPRFRYTPALQGNKQEVASTEPDLVGTYVQQMRETNTPAARAFVQLYESGRITDQDVSDTIARQNPQLQAPAEPAIPSNATPLQAEGIQIEQMRRRAAPTLDLKQPEQAVAERAQAQRAEGDATPELTQQRLEAAAAQGRQQDPMTPVQVGQYIDALRLENTPQARALVQEYEAGRVTDQDVADAVNAQRRYQLGGVDLAQNRIETAATRGAQQAPGLQVERSGARAPNAALAEAVQMYGDMPLTARDMTVEGASERLSRAAAQARQTPESLIQVGDTTQTSRVPFRGRNEAIRTSNEGLDAAAAGRGGERMTAPRPTLIGGKPPGSYTDQQLRDLVGNDVVPAITRRGAETELAVRALQQRAQAPAAPAAPGTTSPGGIILASAKRSPQDVLSSVARSRESKVGRPVQMTVVDTATLPAQRGAARGALSKQAHTIIESVSRVFGKKLVVFESDDDTSPDGFYSRDDPDTIYLNRNSEMPHLVVFGHELMHSLRKDNEAAYQALVKTIKLKEGVDISETPGIRGDIEEFTADLMGNQFRDNEFWVATFRDIIASKGEQQGRQVVTRLAAAAVRAVNGLMKALGRAPGYNTDEMVANLGEVKTALRSALSTYAKDRYGAAVAMERERVAAAPAPAPAAAAAPATTVAPTATEDAQASEKRVEGPFKPARTMSELEGVLASEKRGEGELRTKLNKDGSLTVYGDPDQVRAMLPEGIVGRNVQGGVSFTASQAPRVRAAVEGRRVAYSRQGEVTEKLPMRDGKYIGAPEKYNTPAKISTLRRNLRQLTMEGQAGRYWYENSSREVLAMVGGNVQEARKFVALLSIYSPQAKVDANSTFALRAWAQYKAGQPISVKTGVQDRKATAALQDVDAFWSGEKTGNFFFNLLREIDPSTAGKQGATIDMWMMRAAEYSSDAPTSTQYAFMENETNRIAREMGWEPQQVQAAIWVAMKARMGNAGVKKRTEASSEKKGWIRYDYPIKNGRPTKTRVILDAQKHRDNWLKHAFQHDPTKSDTQGAKFDFSDGLRRHIGQLSWEARPGRTTGVLPGVNDAPYEQQVEFQQAVQKALLDDDGIDLLAYKLGLLVDGPDILAPGVWQGEIAAGMQKQVGMAPAKGDAGKTSIDPAQALAMDAYASVLGMLLRQEGVGYHRPFYKGNRASENAVNLSIGRTFTPAEAQALWSEVDRRMRAAGVADWENGAGLISSPDGMRVVNFGAVGDNLAFQSMVASAAEALPVESVELQRFSTDGNLVMNNWVENPNGEGYRSRVSETYGPDLLDWAGTVLAPRVQSVFDEFSSRYGWGDAGDVAALFPAGQQPAAEVKASDKRSPLGFYSALASGVDGIKTGAAPAQGWKDAIKGLVNKGQVKADEVEWSGVNDWLDLQQGKVSKDQVSEYLKQGGVRVEETQMGGPRGLPAILSDYFENSTARQPTTTEGWIAEAARQERKAQQFQAQGNDRLAKRLFELAEAMNEYAEGGETGALATRYSKYALPGGENYREVLLTLPSERDALIAQRTAMEKRGALLQGNPNYDEDRKVYDALQAKIVATKDYKSSHWDQPNVLAHIRVNDRTDADGKRVLFVEELQSDWGQEGRDKGFKLTADQLAAERERLAKEHADYVREESNTLNEELRGIKARLRELPAGQDREEATRLRNREESIYRQLRMLAESRPGKPRDSELPAAAPFVTKTEGWLNLALKRVMVMAAEGGYDKVAFTTGAQNAERFSLDKHLREIAYEPAGDGKYEIIATDLQGQEVISEDGVGLDRIEELVGKEIAEKVSRDEGEQDADGYREWRYLRGDNLKVEAKGMRAFYDTIVPTAVKKLLPKVGGGQMGVVEIGGAPDVEAVARRAFAGAPFEALSASSQEWARREAEKEAAPALRQPGFNVTPAMRDKVSEGLPLFSEKRQVNTPEFKAWFGDSKVVDENGQPLVVYHGSKWSSITSFDFKPRGFADLTSEPSARMPGWEEVRGTYTRDGKRHLIAEWMSAGGKVLVKYAGGMEILDTRGRSPTAVVFSFMNPREPISDRVAAGHRAAFFSENPEYTGFYSMWGARDGEDAPTTYPVYLRIENPVLPKHWATFEPFYREATKGDQAKLDLAKQAFMNERWEAKEAYPGFIEYAISKGFDGYANVEGGASAFAVSPVTEMAPGGVRTWAVFRPTQVKSAIGNRGAFDLTNPDIRASEKRQTETPEFKRWFKRSIVTNPDGSPMVMYHGSQRDFMVFDRLASTRWRRPSMDTVGSWFSNNPSADGGAGMYSGTGPGAVIYPVYLSIQRPKTYDTFTDFLRDMHEAEGREMPATARGLGSAEGLRAKLKAQGYDGIAFTPTNNQELIDEIQQLRESARQTRNEGDRAPKSEREVYYAKMRRLDERREMLEAELSAFGGSTEFDKQVVFIAFENTQIKSAIGNRGAFDPTNPDIRASEKRNIFNQRIQPAWSVAPDTKLDAFLYKLQDKQIDLKRITQAIKDAIGGLAEKWDAYLAEELYHGRTAKQTKDFLQDEMKPLVDAMTANRVTMPELEEYLHNRHAEERNRQIATINPNLPDAGSGIATADARRYLAGLPANQRQRYEALARQVDAINKKTRQLLVSSGLEKQDTIDAWERTYPTYVPLFREDADYDGSQSRGGTGLGFSVRGPSSKRATGSADREVVDILANVALMRERTITRAEKTRVGRALYGLAVQNPNPGFWLAIDPKVPKDIPGAVNSLISMGMTAADARGLMQQPTVPHVDPRTGLVTYRVNPLLRNADHVMSVRVDGEDKMLVFNPRDERAQRMVTSLKNLDAQQLGGALSAAAFVSRWFAQVNTQYNPVFGAINLIRDVGGAAFNLTTTEIADRKAQVMAGVGPALVGIYQDLRKNRTGQRSQGQWAQLWEEFQREGGQTGFRDMFSRSEERAIALQRMIDPASWADSPLGKFFTAGGTLKAPMEVVRKGAAPVFNWLSDYNETLENAVRLSAYKAAKDKGLSNAKAASIAKNLTVNFNRKGQVGVQMGALYAFFNASVQGTARLAETLGSGRDPNASAYSPNRYMGKTGQRIIAGGLLLGVMQAVALAMAGFDEDEPPEFIKERNLVIPLDWVDNLGGPDLDGKYLTIPMPLGLNVIPNTGRVLTEWWMSGFKDTPKRVASITGSFLEMFNPIGNAGWSVQTIAPTFADPLVALSENRDWTGKPIAKEDRSGTDPTPGYTRAKDTASIISKGIAYALNAVSGGTDYKPGVVSPTPDQIDYLIGQVTGGVGREVLKVSQAVESGVTGEDLPTYKIPVAGRFYGDTKELSAVSSRYYDNLTRMNQHENEIKGRAADRVPIGDYFEDNPEARLVFLSNRIEREVSDLRRRKRELIKREASKESIKMAEEAIRRRMQSLNDAIERAQKRTPNNGLNP